MAFSKYTYLLLAGVSVVLIGCGGPDEKRVTSILQSDLAAIWPGATVEMSGPTVDGSDISYSNVTVGKKDEGQGVTVGKLTFVGASVENESDISADSVVLKDVIIYQNDYDYQKIDLAELRIENGKILAPTNEKSYPTVEFSKAKAGVVKNDSEVKYDIAQSVQVEGSEFTNGIPKNVKINIEGLLVRFVTPNPQMFADNAASTMKAMGFQSEPTLNLVADGSWDQESQKLNLNDLTVTNGDNGKLSISGKFENVDQSLIGVIAGSSGAEISTKLAFSELKIRYDDNSLTYRIVDYIASQQGISRSAFIQSAMEIIPKEVGNLRSPKLQDDVATAVNTYLPDPKSILITMTPKKPISLEGIDAIFRQSPQRITDETGLTIVANGPAK